MTNCDGEDTLFKPRNTKKDRLIAKMVAYAMWGVASFNLVTGFVVDAKCDMAKKDLKALEDRKANAVDTVEIEQIDGQIDEVTAQINDYEKFIIPTVYSFVGTGLIGSAAIAYNELKKSVDKIDEINEIVDNIDDLNSGLNK